MQKCVLHTPVLVLIGAMEHMTVPNVYNLQITCPVETTLGILSGKWKAALLFHLIPGGKRYSELQRLVPDTSDRMLTRSLRELEKDNLINRKVFAEVPVRVEYSLTEDGRTLVPILEAMYTWGLNRL